MKTLSDYDNWSPIQKHRYQKRINAFWKRQKRISGRRCSLFGTEYMFEPSHVEVESEAPLLGITPTSGKWNRPIVYELDEQEEQRRSFAYGNLALTRRGTTRELIDRAADKMASKKITNDPR